MASSRAGLISVTIPTGDLKKLERLAQALIDAGAKDLRRELGAGLRRAARPMPREFKRAALGRLPYRGGLAEWVAAGMRFKTSVRLGASPSMRIIASLPGHDLASLNRGRIRHPVYGHRDRWATQVDEKAADWWDDGGTLAAQDIRADLLKAIDNVASKLRARI